MAVTDYAKGRAGYAETVILIEGFYPALARWAKADPMFNKEIRTSSVELIKELVADVQSAANNAPNPRQAREVARAFRARPDRVPVIRLDANRYFVSQSRPNRKRKGNVVKAGMVFFGSEFGSDRYRQFPERSAPYGGGNQGYWFWPTIEKNSESISRRYLQALDRITGKLSRM